MNEEAKMILELLREGKVTADEATRLLQVVRTDKGRPHEAEGTLFSDLRDTASEVVDRVRKEAKQAIRRANETLRGYDGGTIDQVREQLREAKARLKELKRELKRHYRSSEEESLAEDEQEKLERVQEDVGEMTDAIEELQDEAEEIQNAIDELQDEEQEVQEARDEDAAQFDGAAAEDDAARSETEGGVWASVVSALRGEPTYRWQDNLSGELPSVPVPHIKVRGVNGRIAVEYANDNKWHLAVEKSARASDREAAKSLSRGLYSVEKTSAGLVIAAKRVFGQRRAVNFHLRLPQTFTYDLDLSAVNGSVRVKDVAAKRLRASTTNGQVTVESMASEISLSSVNGRVELTGGAASVKCRTVNGSLAVSCPTPQAGTMSLDTVNGSITVRLGDNKDIGVKITGSNVHGSAQAEGLGLKVDVVRHTVGRRLRAVSEGVFAQWLEVEAKSVHGSINITRA